MIKDQCPVHKIPKEQCGGHDEAFTTLGWEVFPEGSFPDGDPLEPTEEDKARSWSRHFEAQNAEAIRAAGDSADPGANSGFLVDPARGD